MDRMLVTVFSEESKAYQGAEALRQLDAEGSIALYAYAVVSKNANGSATIKQGDDGGPLGTLAGTSVGSLIGVLFGPAGLAIGAASGLIGGMTADLANAGVGDDFIEDVSQRLLPSTVAVVAEIQEDWTTPVDTRMEMLGGQVFRRALSDVKHHVHEENVAAMKADVAQMKAEHEHVRTDRQGKLEEKINQLDSKIQAQLQAAKDRRANAERIAQSKAQVLRAKAASAVGMAP